MKISWVALGVYLALAVCCIVTGSHAMCALVSGGYSGWNSLSSGWWVLRTDHDRIRGRICCAFHVALAFWMGAPAALLSVHVLALIEAMLGRPANFDSIVATLFSLFIAIFASCLIGLVASIAAAVYRVKVWVHPRLRATLGRELQKPTERFNFGTFVLATSVGLPILAVGAGFAVAPAGPWVLPMAFIGGPIFAIYLHQWISRRIFAASILDYWQEHSESTQSL